MTAPGDDTVDPWNKDTKTKFESKSRSEFLDPCQEAATKSIRCLHRNGGDRSMCQDYFQAYRDCKKQWINGKINASKKGECFDKAYGSSFEMVPKDASAYEDGTAPGTRPDRYDPRDVSYVQYQDIYHHV